MHLTVTQTAVIAFLDSSPSAPNYKGLLMKLEVKKKYLAGCPIEFSLLVFGSDTVEYDVPDEFLRDLILHIEGQRCVSLNYTRHLINLMFKADNRNLERLSIIYPAECLTIWLCKNAPGFTEELKK